MDLSDEFKECWSGLGLGIVLSRSQSRSDLDLCVFIDLTDI